jgi:hypothetical protein
MFDVEVVVNRRNKAVEVQYDGKVIEFKPYEKRSLPKNIARNVIAQSMLQLNLETGLISLYGLGIEGSRVYPVDKLDGEMATENPIEVLDRSDSPLFGQTEPTAISASGEKKLGIGKKERVATKTISTGVVQPRGPQTMGDWNDNRVIQKKG